MMTGEMTGATLTEETIAEMTGDLTTEEMIAETTEEMIEMSALVLLSRVATWTSDAGPARLLTETEFAGIVLPL